MSIIGAFILPHPPLILPQIGQGQEKKIQKTIDAYQEAAKQIAALKPDTIVLSTPHSIMYADYIHISPGDQTQGNLHHFNPCAPEMQAVYDSEFVQALSQNAASAKLFAGTMGEKDPTLDHGTIIPLSFVQELYQDYRLVRLGIAGLPLADHYLLGQLIFKTSNQLNRKTVFIASADLSHRLTEDGPYGFAPEGPEFDRIITDAMDIGDFAPFLRFSPGLCEKAGECGLRSCVTMSGALDRKTVKSTLHSYEGPFGVGYAVASFIPIGSDENRAFLDQFLTEEQMKIKAIRESEDDYVRLARHALEHYVQTGTPAPCPADLSSQLTSKRAGVFVSLKKHGELRGCIGTIMPTEESIAKEICRNAVSAAAEDPRFDPVTPLELDQLVYSVDVLSEPEPIRSSDELDVLTYGVIVKSGHKRGLLLPNLDGVDTVSQQIDIARQKAGIGEGQPYTLERFKVVRHT